MSSESKFPYKITITLLLLMIAGNLAILASQYKFIEAIQAKSQTLTEGIYKIHASYQADLQEVNKNITEINLTSETEETEELTDLNQNTALIQKPVFYTKKRRLAKMLPIQQNSAVAISQIANDNILEETTKKLIDSEDSASQLSLQPSKRCYSKPQINGSSKL